jgi:hypothetical protein
VTGLNLNGINQFKADSISIQNFSGDCLQVNTGWTGMLIENSLFFTCQNSGISVTSLQGGNIISNFIQKNDGHGIKLSGAQCQRHRKYDLRERNRYLTRRQGPCRRQLLRDFRPVQHGRQRQHRGRHRWINNNVNAPQVVFSAAGTPLPACSNLYAHLTPVAVSDATACPNGTT